MRKRCIRPFPSSKGCRKTNPKDTTAALMAEGTPIVFSPQVDDSIFGDTEKILSKIKKPRNRYINEALDYYNRLQRRFLLEKSLEKESELVKDNSMSVLKDFEEIDHVD